MKRYVIRTSLTALALLLLAGPAAAKVNLGLPSAVRNKVRQLKDKKDASTAVLYKLSPQTKALTADTNSHFLGVSADSATYRYDISAVQISGLQPGNIIISGQGYGYMRKVVSISQAGNEYQVLTATATFEDAFTYLDYSVHKTLTPNDIVPQSLPGNVQVRSVPGDKFTLAFQDVQVYGAVKADIALTISPTVDFNIDLPGLFPPKLRSVRFVIDNTATANVTLKSDAKIGLLDKKIKVGAPIIITLPPIVVPPVVIPMFAEMQLVLISTAEAGITASVGVTDTLYLKGGVNYSQTSGFEVVSDFSNSFSIDPPLSLSIDGDAKLKAGPEFTVKIAGLAGPYLGLYAYGKVQAAYPLYPNTGTLNWELHGGVEAAVGLKVDIFSVSLADFTSPALVSYDILLSSGHMGNNAPTISSFTTIPAGTVSPGAAVSIRCNAADIDVDSLHFAWSAASGTLSSTTGNPVTWTAPAAAGNYTVGVTVSDNYGGSVQKSTNVAVAAAVNNPPVISSLIANPASVSTGAVTTVTCAASDSDGDSLTYVWSAASGTISGSGPSITWTAPASSGSYTVSVTVSDGKGGSAQRSANVPVTTVGVGYWQIQTIESVYEFSSTQFTSIALDTNNNPHISYYRDPNNTLKYAKWTGTSWSTQTVDSTGNIGSYTSIILDSANNPHISYYDATNGDLKYAKWTGTAWFIQTVDSAGNVGSHTTIALDSANNPHISYYDATNGDLKYAKWTGTAWFIQTVDSAGNLGLYTSITLDSSGKPHISYYDGTTLGYLKYAKWTGSSWSIQTVDSYGTGYYTSITLDSVNNPHISYGDTSSAKLKYAKWTGSTWAIQIVDSAIGSGYNPVSITLNSTNNPYISYGDTSSGSMRLKSAKGTGASWFIQIVDTAGLTGYGPSIALDSNSNPHISYYAAATKWDLRYAKWANNSWPIIFSLTANPSSVSAGAVTTMTCVASGPNTLTYHWSAVSGTISGSGSQIQWTAPASSNTYTITCTVSNSQGEAVQSNVNITVTAAQPGTRKWEFLAGAAIHSSPAIGPDGTIYVGSEDGKLYAINPDGTKKWEFLTNFSGVDSSPAIGPDGTIYVGSGDHNLYAINPDGSKKWAFITGYYGVNSSPAIGADGTIYVETSLAFYAVNPDGTQKWAFATGSYAQASPAIGPDGTVYMGIGNTTLYAVNTAGTKKWEFYTGYTPYLSYPSPAINTDGTIYIGAGGYEYTGGYKFYAINPNGTEKWGFPTSGYLASPPVIGANGTIYVGTFDNKLYALNSDGTEKWEFTTGGSVSASPVICADGTIYAGAGDNKLYAINSDGTEKWEFVAGGSVYSPTIGADGTIYVGSSDGKLYALYGDTLLANSAWPKFHRDLKNTGRQP